MTQHAGSMRGAAHLAAGFAELPRSGNHPVFHDRFQILLPGTDIERVIREALIRR